MNTESIAQSSYDTVPYPSGPISKSHPSHLAVVAKFFGLNPPSVPGCRVLELGCASGGNLIPMALDLPGGEFVGIDLSSRQIADGNRFLERFAAKNIRLRQGSILDVDDRFGKFDYIVCHGVYSWVPREVQDKILQIGRDLLTPHGIMYVSYNTNPGWHLRGVVRDMMRYHAAGFQEPIDKIQQSRALLQFLVDSAGSHSEAYRQLLKAEAETLRTADDAYLYHEHLEDVNEPLYFHEFARRVEDAELRYLGDADFVSMLAERFREDTAAILRDAPLLRQEQYMDFLTARTFRMSLLCHAEVEPDRTVNTGRLLDLEVRLNDRLKEMSGSDGAKDGQTRFSNQKHSATTSNGRVQAAIRALNEAWPGFVPVRSLLAEPAATEFDGVSGDDALLLADLMTFLTREMVQFQVAAAPIAVMPGPRPVGSPLARQMAELGTIVTNRAHRSVRLDDLARFILIRLDGTRDRDWLAEQLRAAIERGDFLVQQNGQPLSSVPDVMADEILEHVLRGLAERSLLLE